MSTRKDATWFQPDEPSLQGRELEAAYNEQIAYPRIVRKRRDPPVPDQTYCLLSFLPLPEPVDGIYGFVKCRGTASDLQEANDRAKKIVREVDSKFKVLIAKTGEWVPTTESTQFVKEDIDVKMDENDEREVQLNDEAVKEAERRHERIRKEIEERTKKMKDPNDDPYSDLEGIDYYIMKRVTRANIHRYLEELDKKKDDLRVKLQAVEENIKSIEDKSPEYIDGWLAKYNEERVKRGLKPVKTEDDIGAE